MKRYRRVIVILGILFGALGLAALLPSDKLNENDPALPTSKKIELALAHANLSCREHYKYVLPTVRFDGSALYTVGCGDWMYGVLIDENGVVKTQTLALWKHNR